MLSLKLFSIEIESEPIFLQSERILPPFKFIMSTTLELLILGLMSVLLVLQVHRTTGASGEIRLEDVASGKVKVNPKKYVQYVTSKPILTMSSADIQFDGDVYYSNDEMTWDWNDSHQQPSRKPALYLADPFINIQHAPGQFQPMF